MKKPSKKQQVVLWYLQQGFYLLTDPYFLRIEVIGPAWRFNVRRCVLERLVDNGFLELGKSGGKVNVYSLTKLGREVKAKVPSEREVIQARATRSKPIAINN